MKFITDMKELLIVVSILLLGAVVANDCAFGDNNYTRCQVTHGP